VSGIITPLLVDAYGEHNESKPLVIFAIVAALAAVAAMNLRDTSNQDLASSSSQEVTEEERVALVVPPTVRANQDVL
jgi:hypothetical protein